MTDEALDNFEHRDSLRLASEHRHGLIRALIESEAADGATKEEVDAWIEATSAGPLSDDQVVAMAEERIRELTRILRSVKTPLVGQYLSAQESKAELHRIVNARTVKRQATSRALRDEAERLRRAGEKIAYIARKLGRSERWVYEVLPKDLKQRR